MARAVGMRTSSPMQSNTRQAGVAGGTMGGRSQAAGRRPGSRQILLGDEMYLWILVIAEALTIGWLRQQFRRHHGG